MAYQEPFLLRRGLMMLLNYKFSISALIGVALAGIFVWNHQKVLPIAIVDMQRLLNQPAVLLSQSKLSEKEQKEVLKHYSSLLPNALLEYGESHHVTLITATVISSGSFDVTDEIIGATLEKLKTS